MFSILFPIAERFVETILDLSALDAGRIPFSSTPLVLQDVLKVLKRELETIPGAQRVGWEIPEGLPFIYSDEHALVSIFFHLIDNAIKYAPTGPIIVTAKADSPHMVIQVVDHGPGIPTEALPLLFKKFYRFQQEDAQTVYGHGLGLYIVRRLLQMMGGDIQATNPPEGGVCFTFWLPIIEEKDEIDNPVS